MRSLLDELTGKHADILALNPTALHYAAREVKVADEQARSAYAGYCRMLADINTNNPGEYARTYRLFVALKMAEGVTVEEARAHLGLDLVSGVEELRAKGFKIVSRLRESPPWKKYPPPGNRTASFLLA